MLSLLWLLSCAGGNAPDPASPAADANLRPLGSPDVMLLMVAGHCIDCASNYNGDYFASWGTPRAIEEVLEAEGLEVRTWNYVDELYSWASGDQVVAYGYLSLVADLEWVERHWIADFDNPTRIVLVGHSHGVVWAHSAVMATQIPIEVLVDLDGICLNWEDDDWALGFGDDWAQIVDAYERDHGALAWFDLANPCDSWNLGTGEALNIDDVVPWNVRTNLEVRSSDWLLYDSQDNLRYDGSSDTLTFQSQEGHIRTVDPSSDSIRWVARELRSAFRVEPL